MRKHALIGAILAGLALSVTAAAVSDQPIPDDALGLSKTSVYDDPAPAVVDYSAPDAGSSKRVPASYHTAPPMISHSVEGMIPITLEANLCRDCHVNPDLVGKRVDKGVPTPAPVSHYVNVKAGELFMGRYNCTQCHAPQANVKVLVDSTFGAKPRRK